MELTRSQGEQGNCGGGEGQTNISGDCIWGYNKQLSYKFVNIKAEMNLHIFYLLDNFCTMKNEKYQSNRKITLIQQRKSAVHMYLNSKKK